MPIVFDADLDPVLQSFIRDALAGIGRLGFRDRHPGDAAAVMLRCVDRETAPAAADFENVITWSELQLGAERAVFPALRIFE